MQTVVITDQIGKRSAYSNKYGNVYRAIESAIREGREITLKDLGMKSALSLCTAIRKRYSEYAYVSFRKYGRNGIVAPTITVCPRRTK